MKVYKSRIDRGTIQSKIDDKYLLFSYPLHTGETMGKYRLRVYRWHLMNDVSACVFVWVLGETLCHLDLVVEIIKILF